MSRLLVDLGNSRVKWAWLVAGRLGLQQSADYGGWSAIDWQARLFDGRPHDAVDSVVAASVANISAWRSLADASHAATGLSPQRVEATAEACGVRNGYRDPRQLGVDRWLAVVAAFARVHGAACVVDAGTALTVDAVDDTGLHLGGYIVPGLDLMQRALTSSTGDLAERSSVVHAAGRTLLADNTRDAISRGCIAALGALIERAHAALSASSAAPPALLLTGGDAAQIEAVLDVASETVPDLVLQGLRLVTD